MADLTSNAYKLDIDLISNYYGTNSGKIISELNQYSDNIQNPSDLFELLPEDYKIIYNADGSIRNYTAVDTAVSALSSEQQVASEINSNVGSTLVKEATKVVYQIPIQTATETAETATKTTFSTVAGTAGNIVFGKVIPAIAAVSIGATLGKTIDGLLYSANPNFWDEHGMSTLNPETWNSLVSDYSPLPGVAKYTLGTLLKLDPNTGKTQMYLDENAFAYLTAYMNQLKVFEPSTTVITDDSLSENEKPVDYIKFSTMDGFSGHSKDGYYNTLKTDPAIRMAWFKKLGYIMASKSPFKWGYNSGYNSQSVSPTNNAYTYSYSGNTFYAHWIRSTLDPYDSYYILDTEFPPYTDSFKNINGEDNTVRILQYMLAYGKVVEYSTIEGIGTQPSATTPTITGTTPSDVLAELKEQYPDLWNNAISETVVQPDGSTKTYTYVPVATPNFNPTNENQPTTGNSTQADPAVDPNTMPADSLAELIKVFTSTPTDTKDDTGDGKTPIVIPPTGTANALFAIYNPTEAQIKSFGAWLWSPNFVDQLLKMFNNPSEAIIGLHKVFVTPITGAEQNIKVGYLDSGVASKIVTNQYVTIDCGTITLAEFFGNVFDYSPFTDISLYLPFIGIVKLNNADVLRSSINIIYHADVINGSVLAEVKVNRDGAGGTLYQYTGNCAVEYPLSSGSYIGMITGALSLGAGIAGTIASGGNMIPAMMGATAGLGRMHSDVSRSGSFSGNAGAMGIKKPYLIISRPQTELADKFTTFVGKPSNYTTTIGACKGFTKVDTVHIENVDATSSELDELNQILTSGILV